MTSHITLRQPNSANLWNTSRRLVEEYAASLQIDLGFQRFDHERHHLADEYSLPDGAFFLAEEGGAFVGCGGLRRFSQSACEIKRLYVVPTHQHRGIGRMIAYALINQARNLGYKHILLDTLPSMTAAQALYRSLGFEAVTEYRFNPVPGTIFLKLEL